MKHFPVLILLLLSFTAISSRSQEAMKRPIPDYSFVHLDKNQLLFPGDSLAMEGFFEKLDTLLFTGKGHISIMHIGGSHVQAGVFSQQMRDNLLNLCPGLTAGRGLVFPFMTTYANVLLDQAECCFNLGKEAEGWDYIKQIRERAFGNLEVGKDLNKYCTYHQKMADFYGDQGHGDAVDLDGYPFPFNTETVKVPR